MISVGMLLLCVVNNTQEDLTTILLFQLNGNTKIHRFREDLPTPGPRVVGQVHCG